MPVSTTGEMNYAGVVATWRKNPMREVFRLWSQGRRSNPILCCLSFCGGVNVSSSVLQPFSTVPQDEHVLRSDEFRRRNESSVGKRPRAGNSGCRTRALPSRYQEDQ